MISVQCYVSDGFSERFLQLRSDRRSVHEEEIFKLANRFFTQWAQDDHSVLLLPVKQHDAHPAPAPVAHAPNLSPVKHHPTPSAQPVKARSITKTITAVAVALSIIAIVVCCAVYFAQLQMMFACATAAVAPHWNAALEKMRSVLPSA